MVFFAEFKSRLKVALDENKQDSKPTFSKENGFNIPDNYFEDLSFDLKAQIVLDILDDDPELKIENSSDFVIPDNYFNELSESLDVQLHGNEVKLSEVLNGLKDRSGQTAPDGYFKKLEQEIKLKTTKKAPAKVISLPTPVSEPKKREKALENTGCCCGNVGTVCFWRLFSPKSTWSISIDVRKHCIKNY